MKAVKRSPAARAICGRLLALIPMFVCLSAATFFVVGVLPGDAAQQLLGAEARPEQIAQLRAELELDRPAWERYVAWVADAVRGDLGRSIASRQPVASLLPERTGVTVQLVTYALTAAVLLSLPIALLCSRWPGRMVDRLGGAISVTVLSLPSYVIALVLVFVLSVQLRLFPSIGFTPFFESPVGNIRSMTLPALALALPLVGLYSRFLRGDLLEQLQSQDYVVAAFAKGLGPWRVIVCHVMRNSVFGLLTVVALNIGALLGGTVVVEQIFALPGLGQLLLQSIHTRDVMVIQAVVILFAIATVAANCTADLLYSQLDPRVRRRR